MVRTIYICRHGLRANQDPPPTGIDGDVPISAPGEEQAAELGAHLARIVPPIQKIYSSPFYRCLQTVTPAAKLLGLPIHVEAGLGEYYHITRPTHPVPLKAVDSKRYFPDIDTSYVSRVTVPDTGETKDRLWERVERAIEVVIDESKNVDTILIATHAATKIAIGNVLTGEICRAGTCSLDRYDYDEEEHKWKVVYSGDTSFLKNGEQMHWSFDMAYEAGSTADEQSRQSTVKVLLPLDMSGQASGPKSGTLEAADLDSDRPLFKIGEQVYQGQWGDVVGTEMYATQSGEPLGQSRRRITLQPVQTEGASKLKLPERIKQIDAAKAVAEAAHQQEEAESGEPAPAQP